MSSPTSTPEPPYPRPAYAWFVVGVLMVAYTFSFIDRQILALLSSDVIHDLGLSDTQFGLLVGFAFALFYTILGLPIGWAADRYSRRTIIMVGIGVWSVMTAVCGLAQSFWQLFFARTGVGVGEAALSPPAYSMITDYFPPHNLGKALGTYGTGIYIGSGLAFIVGGAVIDLISGVPTRTLPLLGELWGWQLTFIIVGLPGLLIVLLMFTIKEPYRRGVRRGGPDGAIEHARIAEVIRFARKRWKAFAAHFLGFAPLSLAGYGAAAWVPAFFERTYDGFMVAYWFGATILIFGPLGVVAGGVLADRWRRQGLEDCYIRVGVLAAVLLTPFNLVFPLMPAPEYAIMLLPPSVFLGAMPFGVAPAAVQAITPNQMRAQMSALYLFSVNLIGLGLGPPLIGWITDNVFHDPADLRYSLAIVGGLTGVWAACVLFSGLRPYRRCAEEARAWQTS